MMMAIATLSCGVAAFAKIKALASIIGHSIIYDCAEKGR
jgi:hypothetical protein